MRIEHFNDGLGFVKRVYELLPRDGVVIFLVPHLEKLGGNLCHKHFYHSKTKLIPYLSDFEYKFYYYEDATIYGNVGVPEKNLEKSGLKSLVVVAKKV